MRIPTGNVGGAKFQEMLGENHISHDASMVMHGIFTYIRLRYGIQNHCISMFMFTNFCFGHGKGTIFLSVIDSE